MEQETKRRQLYREIMILLIIMMIGVLVRVPIGAVSDVDVTKLNDPDSYLYARKAIELYNSPFSDWQISFTRSEDPLMNSVYSDSESSIPILLSVIVAFICRLFRFVPINWLIYYFDTFLCSLSAIPAFLFVKKHTNLAGGIVASLAMVVAPSYYMHTMHGVFDTDAAIALTATVFVLSHIEAIIESSIRKKIAFTILSFTGLVVLSLFWSAFYYYVAFVVLITLFTFIIVREKELFQIPLFGLFVYLIYSFVKSPIALLNSLKGFFGLASTSVGWPSSGKYIAELKNPALFEGGINKSNIVSSLGVVNWLGGLPFFIIVIAFLLVALFLLLSKKNRNHILNFYENKTLFVFLFVWAALVALIVSRGIRYVQLLALPLNIFLGCMFGILFENVNFFKEKKSLENIAYTFIAMLIATSISSINAIAAIVIPTLFLVYFIFASQKNYKAVLVILISAVFICPISNEYFYSKGMERFASRNFDDATSYVANSTPKDSFVVSWWGYGYYYEHAAQRRVAADGGTYNGAYFYWLGHAFMTEDERLSYGICRMLASGSLDAVRIAQTKTSTEKECADLLKDILVLNRDEAEIQLEMKYGLSEPDAENLLKYTHPINVGNIYLLVNNKMYDAAEPIGYFGLWDFENEYVFKTNYDSVNEKYVFSDELQDSLIVRIYNDDVPAGLNVVYSNDEVTVLRFDN